MKQGMIEPTKFRKTEVREKLEKQRPGFETAHGPTRRPSTKVRDDHVGSS